VSRIVLVSLYMLEMGSDTREAGSMVGVSMSGQEVYTWLPAGWGLQYLLKTLSYSAISNFCARWLSCKVKKTHTILDGVKNTSTCSGLVSGVCRNTYWFS